MTHTDEIQESRAERNESTIGGDSYSVRNGNLNFT
jgi:hypothetical protein